MPAGPCREAKARVKGRQGKVFAGVSTTKARQGRVTSLRLASWNHSGGLWAVGVVSSCLVPGPGKIQDRGNVGLVCES